MSSEERFRAPWGIAIYGFLTVLFLLIAVATAWIQVAVWASDETSLAVTVLAPTGGAMFVVGFVGALVLSIRSQLSGNVSRARGGALSLQAPKAFRVSMTLGPVGGWIVGVGGIIFAIDLALNTSRSRVLIAALVLTLAGLALSCGLVFRMARARLVADGWGLRWDKPWWMSSTQLPWKQIAGIELRGSRLLTMRIAVVTNDGRSQMLWPPDPSMPISKAAWRTLVGEISQLRPPVEASPS